MSFQYLCKSCAKLQEALASKHLDHLHYLVLLECGHWFIQHDPGARYHDPTKHNDYCFEVKKTDQGYWRCTCGNHCHKCDGEMKTFCCPCWQKKDSEFTPEKWCEFCKFWYNEILKEDLNCDG